MPREGDVKSKPSEPELELRWEEPRSSRDPADEPDDDRSTALPPDAYDEYARQASANGLSGPEAKRALSTPNLPQIDAPREPFATVQDTELPFDLEAAIPTVGSARRVRSGPHEIPLDVADDQEPSENTLPLPIPTPVNAVLNADAKREPIIAEPGDPEWHDELTMPDSRAPTVRGRRSVAPDGEIPPPLNPLEESLELALDGSGDAMDLVSARATPLAPRSDDPLVELRDRYAVGDFTGAMSIAEALLGDEPDNSEAARYLESCKDILMQMYKARLGALNQVPRVALSAEQLRWLTLDHRSGFLLSCIDGVSSIEDILDVSGMPPLDTLRILYTLVQQQIIELVPAR